MHFYCINYQAYNADILASSQATMLPEIFQGPALSNTVYVCWRTVVMAGMDFHLFYAASDMYTCSA